MGGVSVDDKQVRPLTHCDRSPSRVLHEQRSVPCGGANGLQRSEARLDEQLKLAMHSLTEEYAGIGGVTCATSGAERKARLSRRRCENDSRVASVVIEGTLRPRISRTASSEMGGLPT